jgi:hypothetical protein
MTAAPPPLPNGLSHDSVDNRTVSSLQSHEYQPYVDNPLPHVLPEGENATPLEVLGSTASDKLVIIMVGLPATGKTHIAKRICRFLSFFHDIPSQIFNVGDYRRQLCGAKMPAAFYDPSNPEGVAARKVACDAALADLLDYVSQDGVRVAALDATNSTFERRQHILMTLNQTKYKGIKKMFVESVCDDEAVRMKRHTEPPCRFRKKKPRDSHFSFSILSTDLEGEHSKGQDQHARLQGHGSTRRRPRLFETPRELHVTV